MVSAPGSARQRARAGSPDPNPSPLRGSGGTISAVADAHHLPGPIEILGRVDVEERLELGIEPTEVRLVDSEGIDVAQERDHPTVAPSERGADRVSAGSDAV